MANLGLGDIAFTGYQATTNDKISFVLLKSIDSGSVLSITDNAWTGSSLTASEGTSVVTFNASFTAGTQFNFDASRSTGNKWSVGMTTTNISDTTSSNFALNASGDNLFAYNGSTPPSSGDSILWVSTFATNNFLNSGVQTTSLTYLPSRFESTNAQLSLALSNGATNENGVYFGGNIAGTDSLIRTTLYNVENWSSFTTAGTFAIPPMALFSVANSVDLKINEIKANPPGNTSNGDKFQYVELIGNPGLSLDNTFLFTVDGNGSAQGIANYVANLNGRFIGSNGLLLLKSPSGGHTAAAGTTVVTDVKFDTPGGILSKHSTTFFLASATSSFLEGNDFDVNNDGVLDQLPNGFSLIDSVGWSDGDAGDHVYGSVSLTQSQGTPDAATRIVGNRDIDANAWFNGDLNDVGNDPTMLQYDPSRGSSNLPVSQVVASLTPGAPNFVATATSSNLRIVSYNVASSSSPGTPRTGIETILQAIGVETVGGIARKIDILAMQEVFTQATTTATIANMLNALYGAGMYAYGFLNGGSAGSGTLGVVYNTESLQLLEEVAVGSVSSSGQPRQTMRYHFHPNGGGTSTDFYLYNSHWKANDDQDGRDKRYIEAQAIRLNSDLLGSGANILYVGDFNVYSASDLAFQTMLGTGSGQAFDPINRLGNWNNNSNFIDVFSQAPAFSAPSGLVGGGLDDRFDFQLNSGELADGLGIEFRPGSYHTFGNNGSIPLNGSINNTSSTALSGIANRTNVLNLLTTVSDHLPVVADYIVPLATSVAPPKVESVVFGDGTAQRSMVQSITVNFDRLVNIGSGAFMLETGVSGNFSSIPLSDLSIAVSSSDVSGKTVSVLTFTSTSTFIQGGSLPDGNYRLTIPSNLVSAVSLTLDGDNDGNPGGNHVKGAAEADAFFRLFGDTNGNRTVSPAEFGQLRASLNRSTPDPLFSRQFDFNYNGVVSPAEFGELRKRLNRSLLF